MTFQLHRDVVWFVSMATFSSMGFTLVSHSNTKSLFVNERILVWFICINHTVITTDAVSAMIIITVPSASTEQTFVWSRWRVAKLACGILAEIRWLFSAWIAPTPTHASCEELVWLKWHFWCCLMKFEFWIMNYSNTTYVPFSDSEECKIKIFWPFWQM